MDASGWHDGKKAKDGDDWGEIHKDFHKGQNAEHKAFHKTRGKPIRKPATSRYGSGGNKSGHNRYHKHK